MDPFSILVVVAAGGLATTAATLLRRRRVVQNIVTGAVPEGAAARVRGSHYSWALDWTAPASLHLIIDRKRTTAFVEVFVPMLCDRDAFREWPADPNGITAADPARHCTRLQGWDPRVMQAAAQSAIFVQSLPPTRSLQTEDIERFLDGSAGILRRLEADAGVNPAFACPRCDDTQLGGSDQAPAGTQSCPSCRGTLLAAHGAQALFDELGLSPGDVAERKGAQTLSCPACHHPMNALLQNDVVIDVCAHCGATWIDGDEAGHFITTMPTP